MKNWKEETINTYNKSAKELAEYFRGIGSRVDNIELAIKLAGSPQNPAILEIGCGDGRDAKEILKRTKNYVGFDISEELVKLAKIYAPNGTFEVADAATYDYAKHQNLDVVFAFASLLHLNKDEVRKVLHKVCDSLRLGGVLYVSMKYRPQYEEEVKKDEYGQRMFYYYYPELFIELASDGFEATEGGKSFATRKVEWFDLALRKK